MSRPSWSVPRRWARPGPLRTWVKSCARGSRGASHGAARATTASVARIASPSVAPRWRRTGGRDRGGATTGSAAAGGASAVSDAGVGERIHRVHEHVDDHDAEGKDQQRSLDHGIVATLHGLYQQGAEARANEHGLDDDRAADEVADAHTEHREHGDECVPERVAKQHPALRQPLAPGGLDEPLLD